MNDFQYTYTYDSSSNRVGRLLQDWDVTQWVNHSHYTYTYDANNNQTSYLDQNWDGTQWGNISQYTYTYDVKVQICGIHKIM